MLFDIHRETKASVMDAMDMCRQLFFFKSRCLIDKRSRIFECITTIFTPILRAWKKFRMTLNDTKRKRKEYVDAKIVRFDKEVRMAVEDN